jgi:hypothetical protein
MKRLAGALSTNKLESIDRQTTVKLGSVRKAHGRRYWWLELSVGIVLLLRCWLREVNSAFFGTFRSKNVVVIGIRGASVAGLVWREASSSGEARWFLTCAAL